MSHREWVKLPTGWIGNGRLRELTWREHSGTGTAALMVLVVLAHHADAAIGVCRVTYDVLCEATGLSRTLVSKGLGCLDDQGVISRESGTRSTYQLAEYGETGWGKLPARRMYAGKTIAAFQDFRLRSLVELNAMKLFLLVVERRDAKTNMAHMTYPQITEASGIEEGRIKRALSLLATHGLVYVERHPSLISEYGYSNAYRLPFVDTRRHPGTIGRTASGPGFFS